MEIIKKITKSRIIIKDLLSEEYDTDKLPIYNIEEINNLFLLDSTKENPYSILGQGNACNFTLEHKILKGHNIHILYYNFKKDGKVKVTKTMIDKIKSLYDDNIFNSTDNIIIILNEEIKDTIKSLNNSLNLILKKDNIDMTKINNNMKKYNINLNKKHFRNVFIFDINTLQYNILNHKFVPKHEIIRNSDTIQEILNDCNCTINQLPIISKDDPVSKVKLCVDGDLCKITRINKNSGESIYYRVCR